MHAAERCALVRLIVAEHIETERKSASLSEAALPATVEVGEYPSSRAMYDDLSLRGVIPRDAVFVDVVGADQAVSNNGEIKRIAERRRTESLMVVVSRDETTQLVLRALGKSVQQIRDFGDTPHMIVDESKHLVVVPLESETRRGTASSTAARQALEECDFATLRTLMPDNALVCLLSIPNVAHYRAMHSGTVEL